ncbi:hypothetical protein AVEN_137872-1 [Araneus ventricosus]|uniref:Histone-lysine N-methyltransferase SETMAR n=1 Tax=Araneus ventricosus TaxID=182803 RepID=A0A4Y2P1B4_ARAVE|nr:hypothetical protein AVEN_137872-1 [Araneus ventricosus]
MLSDGLILQRGDTHTARKTQEFLEKFEWEVCSHPQPSYSKDLAPNVGSKHLSGTRLLSESDVKTATENWLNEQGRDFYQAGLNKLVLRSDKCLNTCRFGDYVEKRSTNQDQRNITPPCLSIRVTTERPAAATDSQALWFLHNSPHYERLMQQHTFLTGYDPSSEVDPKSHTTIIVLSG